VALVDRAGKIIAILAGLVGIVGALIGFINALQQHPRVQLQISKDRMPPGLVALLSPKNLLGSLEDQDKFDFGSVTLDITNSTPNQVTPTLELGGLRKFSGVEVLDPPQNGLTRDYQDQLAKVALLQGAPCLNAKPTWPDRGNLKLDLPLPQLNSNGGHITLAVYGPGYDKVDACLSNASSDTHYIVPIRDSRMLKWYPLWLATLSVLLFATALLLFIQSHKGKSTPTH
jgi:hypothetical protein